VRHNITIVGLASMSIAFGCATGEMEGDPTPMFGEGALDDGGADDATPSDEPSGDDDGDTPPAAALTPSQVRTYLTRIAPYIAGRSLSYDEGARIDEDGEAALYDILQSWVDAPGFGDAIRDLIQNELHASGTTSAIDYELPGNLAYEAATLGLPWSTILTADYCVAADGSHIECDTGAPYAAGVLATKAYLVPNKGRFNLSRAKLMLETFACRIYPMEHDIQPPLQKAELIEMFRAENAAEQTVEEAQGGFGNGVGCYTCHSQFGAHAQLFVRFDENGTWRADATGRQDPDNELGRSFDGLYTSHFDDPLASPDETSQIFGETVANLREAGEVIGDSRLFRECTVKNLIAHPFGLAAGVSKDIDDDLVGRLTDVVEAVDPDAAIGQYVLEVFTDEQVVRTTLAALESAEGQ
jgi:hypothetical protein